MPHVGEPAPDFTLPLCDGEKVGTFTLSEHRGQKLVLAFFPLAFTSVCTQEMCTFSDEFDAFSQLGAAVYGISVDSPFALNAFIRDHSLKVPLLSDFNREVSRAYDVLHDELMGLKGISKRSVFVLDPEGVIRYRWVSDDPSKLPPFEEIRSVLNGLATS